MGPLSTIHDIVSKIKNNSYTINYSLNFHRLIVWIFPQNYDKVFVHETLLGQFHFFLNLFYLE